MGSLEHPSFRRARFSALGHELVGSTQHDNIRSLPDLISFNAEVNPDQLFCAQADAKPVPGSGTNGDGGYGAVHINFKQLKQAVDACAAWLRKTFIQHEGGGKPSAVALYLESDVGLFIYLAALLASGIPAVLLSARLGAKSVRHLLKETGARSILLSKRTERLVAQDVKDLAEVKMVAPFAAFLHGQALPDSVNGAGQGGRLEVDENNTNVLILHSSGTTGLPKPIRLAHRYVLGYAACHRFPENQPLDWMNLSTLPLYHGFGLLAPCLSLSVGLCCVFPPSSVIPAAHSTMGLFTAFGVRSLMTVPSILEDMVGLGPTERSRALRLLQSMHFIATGGGPLNPDVGAALASEGIKLLNHYGATEIGAIAPIFKPSVDYDYRFLRLRTDLGLQLHPVAGGGPDEPQRFKLVGHPFGWERPFEIQDELVKRPDSDHVEVKVLGRRDDLIVLKNGEKVLPRTLEQALAQDAAIKTAVCIGQGQFEIVVLVEPASAASEHADAFVEHVWQLVSQLNPSLDQHAQVSSKRAIISKPPDKSIPRSDKGSVMRKEVQAVFEDEIRAAYEALELETVSAGVVFDVEHLEDSMRGLVTTVLGEKLTSHDDWREEDDLFELGMDSLQATRLARILNASMGKYTDERFTASFIYKHPSAAKLATAVGATVRGEVHLSEQAEDRGPEMRAIADEYLKALDAEETETKVADNGAVVLLTGSTGNLGAHVLGCLAQNDRVARVICVNRRRVGADDDLRARQDQVNSSAGVALSSRGWEKIDFLAANMQTTDLGLAQEQLLQLRGTITHIVHLAWPMDFNRQLSSFRPQLNALKALIELARSAHKVRPHVQPRILFASSISVVRHYSEQAGSIIVPERPLDDPLVTTPMGYAEAKWVCERMLQRVGEKWAHECTPVTVRIGQLSGPERTDGIWKTEEHMPALIKASQLVSAFPSLQGDFSWLPVDRAAKGLLDILFHPEGEVEPVYHLENPVRQSFSALSAAVANELKLQENCIPFDEWLERTTATGYATSLVEFFQGDFQALASGNVVLDTKNTRGASAHLRESGVVGEELIVEYIRRWRETGFLA